MKKKYFLFLLLFSTLGVFASKLACPTVTAVLSSSAYCSGEQILIQLDSNVPGTTYTWTVTQNGIYGAAPGSTSSNSISQTLTTSGQTTGTATYLITPFADGCTGTPIQVVVTVNPTPSIVGPSTISIGSGSTTSISFGSSTPGIVYSWTLNQSGVTGGNSGSNSTGNIGHTLYTTGNYIGQAVYVVTPYLNGCPGNPVTITINVYPTPIAVATPSSETITSGESTDVNLSSNINNTTYTWFVFADNVSGASDGNGDTINQTLTLTNPNSSGTVTYMITPSAQGYSGNSIEVIVTVNSSLGIHDLETYNFSLSPNPVINQLHVKGDALLSKITICNQLGQEILVKECYANEALLDLSQLKSGIYFVQLVSDSKQSSYKIIKQ
ncbi:PKD-like domain-containing protein [Flavobacterium sp.]|uniref:PKD-like domain-containing protein n=1 Tax=Flavobacterium sp. TaxID=239 RepID=UPI0028BD2DE3|nr:PKD-like domain-containing protein [Flavobacterium sp.]